MLEKHCLGKCFPRFSHQAHQGYCGRKEASLHLKIATELGSNAHMVLVFSSMQKM